MVPFNRTAFHHINRHVSPQSNLPSAQTCPASLQALGLACPDLAVGSHLQYLQQQEICYYFPNLPPLSNSWLTGVHGGTTGGILLDAEEEGIWKFYKREMESHIHTEYNNATASDSLTFYES